MPPRRPEPDPYPAAVDVPRAAVRRFEAHRNTQCAARRSGSRSRPCSATISTASSSGRDGAESSPCSTASAPLVSPSVRKNTSAPIACWRTSPARPRTPNVKRRFAAVLPTAVSASATRVGAVGAERRPQQQEQQRVGERREHADAHEARDRPGGHQPRDAAQVVERRAHDRHARVRVVDPVDRHLVDPQPAPLGEHEQLGVEEPGVVAHLVEQAGERLAPDGLEAALGVGEARAQRRCAGSGCRRARSARAWARARPARRRARRVPMARSEWPESSGATSGISARRSVLRSTSM